MKKTIPITIAGQLFYIEEDAYKVLSEYLDSVKAHFASYPDSAEIIADIESRIAEQFLQNSGPAKEKIVSIEHVDKLISVMGRAEDFGDEQADQKTSEQKESFQENIKKRLFRNPDDVVVAGVASGLAAYLGVDPLIVRLIFVVVVLLGGSGILVYILLWVIMPEAKTNTEKLQMRGQPVTLESVNEMVKEKVEEVKKNRKNWTKVVALPFIVLGTILNFLVRIIGRVLGAVLTTIAVFSLFWLVFVFTVTIFNIHSPYVDFPLAEIVTGAMFYVGLIAAFFSAFIPLLFVLLSGLSLAAKRSMFSVSGSVALTVLWFAALTTLGVVGSKVAPQYQNYIESNPAYQQSTKDFSLSGFQKIHVENDINVEFSQATTTLVSASGRVKNLENLNIQVSNDTLNISRDKKFSFCIFCIGGKTTVYVQVPKLTEIEAENASDISSDKFTADEFTLHLSNASRANLQLTTKKFILIQENASYAELKGSTTEASLSLQNASTLEAKDFVIKNGNITTQNGSDAEIYVTDKLNASSKNGSSIVYYGSPQVQQESKSGSRIRKAPSAPSSTPARLEFEAEIPELE